jgi:hypothetical protein
MQAILFEKIKPARAVNVRVVSLEDAPAAYLSQTLNMH